MKILITGANGFLGYYLIKQLIAKDHTVIATGKGNSNLPDYPGKNFLYVPMDFTDPYAVHDVFEKLQPDVVVHAGAMTRLDECEQNQWQAYLVNVEGTVTLLLNAAEQKSFFIFLSTDFVFDGKKGNYSEEDIPSPINFYGKTKLEAEEAVKEYEHDWAIVRTTLVYGKPRPGKGNILSVVREKMERGEEYSVVDDQVRTPTFVEDLASGIISIIERKATGIFHLSGTDILTPYQMACQLAEYLQLDKSLLKKVTAENFKQPAERPLKTELVIAKAKKLLNYQPVKFSEGLRKTFNEGSDE